MRFVIRFVRLDRYPDSLGRVRVVLFGRRLYLASQLARSPLLHSENSAAAGDHSICFASSTLIPEPIMKYAG